MSDFDNVRAQERPVARHEVGLAVVLGVAREQHACGPERDVERDGRLVGVARGCEPRARAEYANARVRADVEGVACARRLERDAQRVGEVTDAGPQLAV